MLWTLPRFRTPRPQELGALLAVGLLAGAAILTHAFVHRHSASRPFTVASIVVALATWSVIGIYVWQILGHDEGPVPIVEHAAPPAPRVNTVRLLDLNVLHGYPDFVDQEKRFAATLAELQRLDPDILVLQEVWNIHGHGSMADRLGKALGLSYAYARANGSRALIGFEEGGAILSRFPILEARRLLLKPRTPWWENRIALIVKLRIGEETLTVAGAHLTVSSPDGQAEHLAAAVQAAPPDILAGDLNAVAGARAVRAFERGFTEAIPEPHPQVDPAPPIDHVFFSDACLERWRASATVWVPAVALGISDHDGILVDMQRRQ